MSENKRGRPKKSTVDVSEVLKRKETADFKRQQKIDEGEFKELNQVTLKHNGIIPDVTGMFTEKQIDFLQLYIPMKFNITMVCKKLGITRATYNNWCKHNEDFKKAVEEMREFIVDYAESVLIQALDNGDVKAAQFILKTVGKHRGYVENIDVTSNGHTLGSVINIIPPSEPTDDNV